MIVVRLMGGLGNQMFQYAFGRRFAYERDLPLKLDAVTGFKNDPYQRAYRLNHLQIREDFASQKEISCFGSGDFSLFCKLFHRGANLLRPPSWRYAILRQRGSSFHPEMLQQKTDNILLHGYWQSENYFLPVKEIIKKEFRVRHPLQGENLSLAREILHKNSVCLHMRNYGPDQGQVAAENSNKQPVLGWDYYYRALEYLQSRDKGLHCFVFSDDPEWASRNLQLPCSCTMVTQNHAKTGTEYEDLRLMSLCRHYIIANSTFSWWGAWLGDRPGKVVIAPKKWHGYAERESCELYPRGWMIVD